jgi:hypothetical protein
LICAAEAQTQQIPFVTDRFRFLKLPFLAFSIGGPNSHDGCNLSLLFKALAQAEIAHVVLLP